MSQNCFYYYFSGQVIFFTPFRARLFFHSLQSQVIFYLQNQKQNFKWSLSPFYFVLKSSVVVFVVSYTGPRHTEALPFLYHSIYQNRDVMTGATMISSGKEVKLF